MKKEHKIILGVACIAAGIWLYYVQNANATTAAAPVVTPAVAPTVAAVTTTPTTPAPTGFAGPVGNVQK